MAEALFKQALSESKRHKCNVSSAGISAMIGHKADPKACQLMKLRGLDLSGHRACQLNKILIRKSDIIFVMESTHKIDIESKEPSAKGKVFRLGEWGGYDISDPYKMDLKAFESVLEKIDQGVSQWIKRL
jgi:protein-tyrosine phosphatase